MGMERAILALLGLLSPALLPTAAAAPKAPGSPGAGGLSWSGSLRLRQEMLQNSFRPYPAFNRDQSLFSSRALIGLQWRSGGLRLGAELQDSRAWGASSGDFLTTGEVNALEPVQLYVGWERDAPFGEGSRASIQAGRFSMNLGSRRLVASDDYRNTTNGYTGLRGDLGLANGTQLTAWYTLPQVRLPLTRPDLQDNDVEWDRESRYLRLWGLLLGRKGVFGTVNGEIGYVGYQDADTPNIPTRDRRLHTVSARLYGDPAPGKVHFEVEGFSQFGRARTGVAPGAPWQDVAASAAHAHLGYSFSASWKPRLTLEYAFASGDGPGDRDGRFDTLYGMRKAEFAPSGIYSALGRTNIESLALRFEAVPTARLDGNAVLRTLRAASPTDFFSTTGIRDASGAAGSFAGHQVEVNLRYWLLPKTLRAEFSGAWLARRGLLRDAPNAPPWGDTTYGSLALTYSFGVQP